ncbi:hypothetical protein SAMD00019534_030210, partial [Acytostelium subglobosum LB1]|uniref:hypothetical protein n=1 Tax=Acytostelium subglobosum LB1 TaxID=1410327 RepID=UPI000644A684
MMADTTTTTDSNTSITAVVDSNDNNNPAVDEQQPSDVNERQMGRLRIDPYGTSNDDEEVEQEEEEEEEVVQPVYEISATDHINKSLLERFRERIEAGEFKNHQDDGDENDEEWQ